MKKCHTVLALIRCRNGVSPDHIPDHNARWGTWKHRIQDRQRALFLEQKPLYIVLWKHSQTINSLWDQDVGGSSPFTPTIFLKDISEMSLRNILNKQRMKGIEGER